MPGEKSRKKLTRKSIITIIAIVVALALAIGGCSIFKSRNTANRAEAAPLDTVERGNLEVYITGSGSVEPYERFEIMAPVNGDILSSPYDVGDKVEKDDVLYVFDSSDMENTLERSRISYNETMKTADNLIIEAPCDGVLSNMNIAAGDEIKQQTHIADIADTKNLTVTLPFTSQQALSIYAGQSARVSSSEHMDNVAGTVKSIESTATASAGGGVMYNVEIQFENPGAYTKGMQVGGSAGDQISSGSGTVKYANEESINAQAAGTVSAVYHKNGDYVKKGTVIAKLYSDTISNNISKAQMDYEDTQSKIDEYTVKSPISGTVITRNSKAGDTIDRTNSSVVMMVVADVSKLKFSLEIDELDVNKVTEGQIVDITCEALPEETFEGIITNVSVEGTTQNNVTTYTAEVVIDNPGSLRPSMNVDASVIIQSSENTLMLPVSDVKSAGNLHYVYMKGEDAEKKNAEFSGEDEKPSETGSPERPGVGEGEIPQGEKPEMPGGGMPDGGDRGKSEEAMKEKITAPEGFAVVFVEVGISNDEYIEILSGLEEGDQVYQQTSSSSSQNGMMMGFPGGGGGMMPGGGGMPSGGMPGGMGR